MKVIWIEKVRATISRADESQKLMRIWIPDVTITGD